MRLQARPREAPKHLDMVLFARTELRGLLDILLGHSVAQQQMIRARLVLHMCIYAAMALLSR